MNSDLKRARNKRKRAKLRAKKALKREETIMRLRFKTNLVDWKSVITKEGWYPSPSTIHRWEVEAGCVLRHDVYSGEFFTTMHEANSSIVEYLIDLCSYLQDNIGSGWARIHCEIHYGGQKWRKSVWQGHAIAVEAAKVVAEVCSFMSQPYSELHHSQESSQFLSSKEK